MRFGLLLLLFRRVGRCCGRRVLPGIGGPAWRFVALAPCGDRFLKPAIGADRGKEWLDTVGFQLDAAMGLLDADGPDLSAV